MGRRGVAADGACRAMPAAWRLAGAGEWHPCETADHVCRWYRCLPDGPTAGAGARSRTVGDQEQLDQPGRHEGVAGRDDLGAQLQGDRHDVLGGALPQRAGVVLTARDRWSRRARSGTWRTRSASCPAGSTRIRMPARSGRSSSSPSCWRSCPSCGRTEPRRPARRGSVHGMATFLRSRPV